MAGHFTTLFDRHYLSRGLVLYRSLRRVAPEAQLWVFCMDQESEALLRRLALPGLRTVALAELERFDPELAAVKPSRSRVEYCWTATASTCLYLLEHEPEAALVTYLDADLMFFSSPAPLFAELGDGSILLTPHGLEPGASQAGRFCVQFLPFRRDESGLAALRWWRERCLEWCYDRLEDGKFGDQRYLDDWPSRFSAVRVLHHPGALGPWDAPQRRLERRGGQLVVDGEPLVFFHFAALWLYRGWLARAGGGAWLPPFFHNAGAAGVWGTPYPVRKEDVTLLWNPYVAAVAQAERDVAAVGRGFDFDGRVRLGVSDVVYHACRTLVPRSVRRRLVRRVPDAVWPVIGRRYRRG